ncbi:putative glycolipid-binding domain-containing protein [Actinoplanes utahensis]|uniref:Glycolipid-binding family protein n=1 Tax=Actinoplanes utahensis TaxID=1869 RepID=A0A0A6UPL3_ACTUT|nr:putative glycolipid-binding domain-containing protein [Actinoplanes utahensis]KHD78085.1 hypothetical protein MB27_06195 [Actinoplanes utahensis]GIF30534.1 hypothetical protein Aut01nite_35200 [Actinoplanes utahensis]
MSETLTARVETRPIRLPTGPLAWQRTAVTGTELVFADTGSAEGTAVVTGSRPHTVQWRAELAEDATVTALRVSCLGKDLHLTRDDGLGTDVIPRLADSPVFVTWAINRLGLTVGSGAVRAPSLRILTPSLETVPGTATYHLVSPNRLRITGDGPAVTYEVDDAGLVTYQPGNLRLVR